MSDILPEFIAFAERLAECAGGVIRPLFRTSYAVDAKQDTSPVTIADREAERVMRELIQLHYPDHGIMGEEYGNYQENAKYCWVLDPVDGTKSFISGIATFGTLISLLRLGVPVLGIIDQPIQQERWLGVVGRQTTFNNHVITTRACVSLAQATLATTSPYLFDESEKPVFEKLRSQARYTVYGHDCYAYAQCASGFIDIVMESGLKPHDFCALRPVIEQAGGVITDWQGQPLTQASKGQVLAVGDRQLHATLIKLINA